MDSFFKYGAQRVSTPADLNSEMPPVQNFAFGGIANPGQTARLRSSDRSYLDARQAELDKFEADRLAYNDALTKWQTEVYNPYKTQVDQYNAAADKYNVDVYNPYKAQVDQYNQALEKYNTEVYNPYKAKYDEYEKAINAWNAGERTSDYAGPAAPTLASTFDMTAPTAPKAFEMTAPTAPEDFKGVAPTLPFDEAAVKQYQQDAASRARKDASNRAVAIDVVSNPDQFNFGSMSVANRFMAEGGSVDKNEDFDRTAESVVKDFEGYGYTPEEMMKMADEVAAAGRGGDELLAYLSPESVEFLKAHGGSGTINPITGLPEFKGGIIGKLVNSVRRIFGRRNAGAAAAASAAAQNQAQAAAPAQAEAPKAPTAAELMEQLKAANDAKAALQTKYDTDMASFKTQAQKDQEAAVAAALKADAEKRAATIAAPVMGQQPVSGETMTAANMLKTIAQDQTPKAPTQQEIAMAMQRNTAPPPPSGSVVPPSSQYGVPTSSDGKWLYSDGKWQPNQQVSIDPIERASGPAGAISQPGIGATSPITAQGPTAAKQITAGPGFSAIDSSYLKNLTSMDPRWFTKKGEEQTTQQPRTTAQGPDASGTFEGQLPYVPNTPSYSDRGVGAIGSIPIGGISTPGMPTFGNQQRSVTSPSNYFGMSQPSMPGINAGTTALGPSDMPLYGALPTMNAIGSNKNLSPTMLGGQQSAGVMTDRLGNRIYSPGMAPLFGFAKGGSVPSISDILAQNTETLSDDQPEEAINTDPVGTAQQYLSALSGGQERTSYSISPNSISVKRVRSSQAPSGSAKEMAMQYESLTKDDLGAMKDMKPKARDTDSARAQLEEMARQYKLKLRAVENKAKGLATDTFGVPTLETPTLMKNSLAKKRFEKGGEAKKAQAGEGEPSLFGVSDYATRASERMFPDQMGQDDQRDAARHMLASAMVARKTTPGVAEFLGKAHERLSNPESFFNMFGIGQPRDDYAMDVHNNRIGAELAARSKSQAELEKLVQTMAAQAQNKQTPGKPWTMSREQMEARKNKGMTPPPEYAHGGAVHRAEGSPQEGELSDAEREVASRPAFVTPKSGKGRKEGPISKALKSGEAYTSMAKGVTELPYDIAGAPVDIATLLMRPLGYNVEQPVMGSDWIKSKMTGAGVRPEPPSDPTQRGFFTAGELLSNLTNPAGVTRAGVKGAEKAGKAATAVAKDFQEYNRQLTVPGASYAVRQTNPQFIPNKVLEGTLERSMPPNVAGQPPESRLQELRMIFGQEAVDTGQGLAPEVAERVLRERDRLVQEAALGKWVNTTLRKYITRDMATPNDPVREMAEQGVMAKVYEVPESYREMAIRKREDAGMAPEGLARSEAARMWEDLADVSFRSTPAGFFLDAATEGSILANNPWLARLDPNTPITRVGTRMAGEPQDTFQHIVDVLKSDMEAGKIRPESLNKMSMADAVKRAHDYNLEKAKIAADARKAAMADRPVYRKYDNDYQWIQLTKPGDFAAESDAMGHSVRGYEPVQNSPDWVEASGNSGLAMYGVGGWEGVKSGKAKIYSLRDTSGDPHGTIEVMSVPVASPAKFRERGINFAEASDAAKRSIGIDPETEAQYIRSLPVEQREKLQQALGDALVKEFVARTGEMPIENHILQIKGKSNDPLVKKYQKYAQDFVLNGKWDSVADLGNAGLHQTPQGYMTSEQMIDLFESLPDNVRKSGFVQERIKWLRNNSEPNHDYYDSYLYAKQTF